MQPRWQLPLLHAYVIHLCNLTLITVRPYGILVESN